MATALTKEVFTKYLQDMQEFLTNKFEQIDARFDQHESRFDKIDRKFERIEAILEQMQSQFGEQAITLNFIRQEIVDINKRLDELTERTLADDNVLGIDDIHLKKRVTNL